MNAKTGSISNNRDDLNVILHDIVEQSRKLHENILFFEASYGAVIMSILFIGMALLLEDAPLMGDITPFLFEIVNPHFRLLIISFGSYLIFHMFIRTAVAIKYTSAKTYIQSFKTEIWPSKVLLYSFGMVMLVLLMLSFVPFDLKLWVILIITFVLITYAYCMMSDRDIINMAKFAFFYEFLVPSFIKKSKPYFLRLVRLIMLTEFIIVSGVLFSEITIALVQKLDMWRIIRDMFLWHFLLANVPIIGESLITRFNFNSIKNSICEDLKTLKISIQFENQETTKKEWSLLEYLSYVFDSLYVWEDEINDVSKKELLSCFLFVYTLGEIFEITSREFHDFKKNVCNRCGYTNSSCKYMFDDLLFRDAFHEFTKIPFMKPYSSLTKQNCWDYKLEFLRKIFDSSDYGTGNVIFMKTYNNSLRGAPLPWKTTKTITVKYRLFLKDNNTLATNIPTKKLKKG